MVDLSIVFCGHVYQAGYPLKPSPMVVEKSHPQKGPLLVVSNGCWDSNNSAPTSSMADIFWVFGIGGIGKGWGKDYLMTHMTLDDFLNWLQLRMKWWNGEFQWHFTGNPRLFSFKCWKWVPLVVNHVPMYHDLLGKICVNMCWLVVSTPLKNMKVSWGYYSQHMEKYNSCSKPPTRCVLVP